MKHITYLTLLLFGLSIRSYAQDSIQVFTLQQCVNEALKNNIQLKQTELTVESAIINRKRVAESRYPNLNANVGPGTSFGRAINPVTNTFIIQQIVSSSFSISSNVTLFNGLRITNSVKQNSAIVEATKYELKDSKNTLLLNVLNAYVQILYNKEALTNAQNQLKVTEAQVARSQKLVTGGIAPESQLLDLISKQANEESLLINAENQLNIAKLNLIQFMNLPLENYSLEKLDIEVPVFIDSSKVTDTPSEIYQLAEKTQPAIKGAELRLKSSKYGFYSARGTMYPSLTMSAGINSYYSNASDFSKFTNLLQNKGESISLNLSIPIYGNRNARANVELANITRKNADLNLQNSKIQLRKKIEQAYIDAKSSQKKFEATQAQVKANEEAFRVTDKRFNSGVINSVDYTISSNILIQTRSALLQAKYDLILKKKILEFYKYNDIIF